MGGGVCMELLMSWSMRLFASFNSPQVRYPKPWSKDLTKSLKKAAKERDADFKEAYEEALCKMNIASNTITNQVTLISFLPPLQYTSLSSKMP